MFYVLVRDHDGSAHLERGLSAADLDLNVQAYSILVRNLTAEEAAVCDAFDPECAVCQRVQRMAQERLEKGLD